MNRKKLLRINSTASLICQFVTLICGFILPRLIIDNYGSAVNGLIASITQFLGIISLCELGMGAVVPASLYKPLAEKDQDQISRVVVSSERFYRKIALIMLAYVACITIFYPFVVDGYSYIYTASLIVIIASSTFVQYFFGVTYALLITADQRQYVSYALNATTLVLNLVLSYALIKIGCSIHIVKLVSSVVFICRPLFYIYYVKRHYNLNKSITIEGEPIKQKWNGVAQHIAFTVQEKTGIIVLSLMATLEEVSIYSIYFLIMEGIRGFIYSVTSSLTSFLGNIIAKGETDTLTSNFKMIEWSLHTITILIFSCTAVLIVPFIQVYTLGVTDANYVVPVFPFVMCAVAILRCLQMPYNIVVQAAGHFKQTQTSAMIEPAINIILSVSLVKPFGLTGVAIGMAVSLFYRLMYLSIYLTKNILRNSKLLLCKRLVVDVIIVFAIVWASSIVVFKDVTYISWIIMALKVLCIASVMTLFVNMIFYKNYVKSIVSKLHF